ncbi:MAG: hypothetical protein KDK44_00065 [Chlamydiia bacterium]|nr:hypothetical protein [Chlamydiia bacterium]
MSYVTSAAVSTMRAFTSELGVVGRFLPTKSGMKTLQCGIINWRTYEGKNGKNVGSLDKTLSGIDFGSRFFETIMDSTEVLNRIQKVAGHIILIISGEESVTALIFDGIDLGVTSVSAIRGIVKKEGTEGWGVFSVSKEQYMAWTFAKMFTSAIFKGYVAFGKRNTAMDPVKRARDILIVIMLTQCAVTAFFDFYRQKGTNFKTEKDEYSENWKGGFSRLFFYSDPVEPIDPESIVRYFAWVEKYLCNSLIKRYVGVGIALTSFGALRNDCMAASAA